MRPRGTLSETLQGTPRLLRGVTTWLGLGAVGAVSLLSGCGSDGLTPGKVVAQDSLYWALELNRHAVVLEPPGDEALYDTLTVVATPRTITGAPLDGLPAVTYVSGDPDKVAVLSDGVLRARAPTVPGEVVPVVATLTAGNLKHADTVQVVVLALDPRPVLDSLSIHPIPPDSAKVGAGYIAGAVPVSTTTCFALLTRTEAPLTCSILLPVTVLDTAGAPIPGVPVAFHSSDKGVASVLDDGTVGVHYQLPGGEATFYASTTVFGLTKADTLPFQVGWPVVGTIDISRTGFGSPALKVGTGAIVRWKNVESFAVDVNFADPTNVVELGQPAPSFLTSSIVFVYCHLTSANCEEAGNIVLSPVSRNGVGAIRRFPVPGVYDYSSTALGGASGRIIVVDER